MSGAQGLQAELETGASHVARCWMLRRKDGRVLGFTDHDRDLAFDGITFRADTGLTARALSQSTGLSVDNSEAMGALSDLSIREEDIAAGRFDGAEVQAWLVNWSAPENRALQFRGTLGEITRKGGAFWAELRGLAEAMNQAKGRVYHSECSAVLGDRNCRFDTDNAAFRVELPIAEIEARRLFRFDPFGSFEERWFEKGKFTVLSGNASGLVGVVKLDHSVDGARLIELWEPFRTRVEVGDLIRLEAGCDKRMETCRAKFNNLANFRGFPDIPGENWQMSYPARSGDRSGGSRR